MYAEQLPLAGPVIARRVTGLNHSPVRQLLALSARPDVISFAGGFPAPELFDVDGLRAGFAEALADPSVRRNLQYSATEGNAELRELLAERLTRRGLSTGASDLLTTNGSQQALTMLTTALVDPGDVVLVAAPTYLAALQCFHLAGARVVPVAGDAHGIAPDALTEACRRYRPSLLYLIPTFANPTGHTMPLDRRRELAEVARRHSVWIVEDDPYGELRYRGEHLPPVAALPEAGEATVYVGSFSKTSAPGLRLGWVRAPGSLRRTLMLVKEAADLHSSTVDQAAAAVYLRTADLDGHLRAVVAQYRDRCSAMLDKLPSVLPPGSRWTSPEGGMFVWVRLPDGADASHVLTRAVDLGVAFVPGSAFYPVDPDHATLRLSFTTNTPDQISTGLSRLREALRQ
ncbi:PLP-dependent aminotransferase family protein [Micromonospora sp. FIMYZ51]|uniref:aminotransferase-like domain-containing protein n=1 Tax=Micromonospora sp. FIMYZ51 TaxID=3051832 RepID=UPI00311E0AD6